MPNFLRVVKNIYKKFDDKKPYHRIFLTITEPLPVGEYYAGVFLHKCKTKDGAYLGGYIERMEVKPEKPVQYFGEKSDDA